MTIENIISEFESLEDAEYFVKVTPKRWGMETYIGIYKNKAGAHQNYCYALFYTNYEINDDTDIVLINGNSGLTQPPIRRNLKWLKDNFHVVFKTTDLIKEIETQKGSN